MVIPAAGLAEAAKMPLIFMRVPSLLIVLLSWWLLRRKILDRIVRVSDRTLVRGSGSPRAGIPRGLDSYRASGAVVGLLLVVQFIVPPGTSVSAAQGCWLSPAPWRRWRFPPTSRGGSWSLRPWRSCR